MSGDRHLLLVAWILAMAAACGGGGGGDGKDIPSPANLRVEPSRAFSGHDTAVVITGDNFLARPAGSSLDTRHQAWLGEAELVEVQWVTAHELRATVPAGLPAGKLPLRVRNAYGREGTLADAFTIETTAGGALAVTSVALGAAAVNVGQAVTVTATVQSVGTSDVSHVVPALPAALSTEGGGAASVTDGPTPAAAERLAPGESATFTWTVRATAAGQRDDLGAAIALELPVTASGDDAFSGLLVQADARTGKLVVDEPAGLTATVVAGRGAVDVGQAVPVTFSVTNGGTAAADLDPPVPSASLALAGGGSGKASCSAPSPAGAAAVGAHGSRAFTWTCSGSAAGVLTVTGSVTGKDANTGAVLSASPASVDHVAVQTPAALSAAVAVPGSPAAVNVGQPVTLQLTVANSGGAAAHVVRVTPTSSLASTSCAAATPAPPAAVAGGGTVRFTWTCTPAAAGTLTLGATVAGTDDNTDAALAASATAVTLPVQLPAALVAIPSVTPATAVVDVGQAVTVSLLVYNGNGAAADLTAVTPALDPSSTAPASCTAATPAPGSIASLGHATFTWTCTPSAAGRLQLTATVTGTDHNSGAAIRVTPQPFPVAVQTPASVAVTELVVDRGTVATRQEAKLTLSLRNSGGADARVTITPTATPAGPSCTPAPPAAQLLAGGGGTLTASWACTSSAAGTFSYGATIAAVDANTGASTSPVATPVAVAVQAPAALSPALSLVRTTLDLDQRVTVTLGVTNRGGATAAVSAVAPSATAGTGAVACDAGPREALPVSIRGGATASFTWSCTGTSAGGATLGAGVTATDTTDGGSASAAAPALGVTVQAAAGLSASLAADRTVLEATQSVAVTLTVRNTGGGAVLLSGVAPSATTGAVACPAAPVEALGTLAGGGSAIFHWTCAGAAPGTATLDATVAGTAVNTGVVLSPSVAGIPVTVQAAAALHGALEASAATVRPGQGVDVTLKLQNTGGATARVSGVVPSVGGVTGKCTAPSATAFDLAAGASLDVSWTCTPAAAGAASIAVGVTATDANTGARIDPVVDGVPVTVLGPASLTATLSATPTSVGVGGAVSVTLVVTNAAGSEGASVISVAPQAGGAAVTCPPVADEGLPVAVAGGENGGTATFHWSCAGAGAGSAVLGATVTAAGLSAVSSSTVTVSVVAPAGTPVTGTLTASPATLPAAGGGTATLTLTLRNPGRIAVRLAAAAVDPLVDAANTAGFDCTAPPVAAVELAPGATLTSPITWTCASRGGPVGAATSFGARAAATDVNGADASGIVTGGSVRLQ